ncbi:MAG TPA: S24 family peptidase [Thermoanaerobaculia bacterium]|jgi:repressor LexA|nr:S24 family peptidase [Thermoanaerobaculia bacterium]
MTIEIPSDLWNRGARHAARAVGDSMVDAGIGNGDVVFFRRTRNVQAARGHVVVCRVNSGIYIKRLVLEGDELRFESDNVAAAYPAIVIKPDDEVELYGVVVLRN